MLKDAAVLSQHFCNHGYRAVGDGKIFHALQWTPGDSQDDPAAWDAYRGDPLDPISRDWVRAKFESDAEMGIAPGRLRGPTELFGAAPLSVPDEKNGRPHAGGPICPSGDGQHPKRRGEGLG